MLKKPSIEDAIWAGFFWAGVGGIEKMSCLANLPGGISEAWRCFKKNKFNQALKDIFSQRKIESIARKIAIFDVQNLIEKLEKEEIGLINFYSEDYPEKLKLIDYPPLTLYCLGKTAKLKNLIENNFNLAIVGSRKTSDYGRVLVQHLISSLANRRIALISGLAVGTDSLAHRKALETKQPNIAVLAGGLDKIYPNINNRLAKEIVETGGFLISEFPPGSRYFRQNFPARNRIISGLCDTLLITEAGKKSGALITADFAFKQGKKVFAVPGNIFSPLSQGTNELLDRGARPFLDSQDFTEKIFEKNQQLKETLAPISPISLKLKKEALTILETIKKHPANDLDGITKISGLKTAVVCAEITQLEITGLIEKIGEQFYAK